MCVFAAGDGVMGTWRGVFVFCFLCGGRPSGGGDGRGLRVWGLEFGLMGGWMGG